MGQRGSHVKLRHEDVIVIVPVHGNKAPMRPLAATKFGLRIADFGALRRRLRPAGGLGVPQSALRNPQSVLLCREFTAPASSVRCAKKLLSKSLKRPNMMGILKDAGLSAEDVLNLLG